MPQFQSKSWNNLPPAVKASDLYGNPSALPVTFSGTLIYLHGKIPLAELVSAICR